MKTDDAYKYVPDSCFGCLFLKIIKTRFGYVGNCMFGAGTVIPSMSDVDIDTAKRNDKCPL